MEVALGVLRESLILLNRMSVYLLFGFFVAGVLHIFINTKTIARHLGKGSFASVVKASLFGIPLPLCSCGVLPAALSLRKDGASKGSVLSFLISTPTTGIDSIFATYALLGGFFAFYRVVASFLAGCLAGITANIFLKDKEQIDSEKESPKCKLCTDENHSHQSHSLIDRVKGVFSYAFGDLLEDVGPWLVGGLLIGGLITYLMPESFIQSYIGSGIKSMVIMFIVGIPMYVCSSGSIPIAAALMLKGMSPGAAFVFLLAGPATNSVALTVIGKKLGKSTVFIFLMSIIVCGFGLGILLDHIWQYLNMKTLEQVMQHARVFPRYVEIAASIVLVACVLRTFVRTKKDVVENK